MHTATVFAQISFDYVNVYHSIQGWHTCLRIVANMLDTILQFILFLLIQGSFVWWLSKDNLIITQSVYEYGVCYKFAFQLDSQCENFTIYYDCFA